MLTETLIVATLLITVLLFMYVQFKNVMRSYERSFKYNTINNIYALNNAKKYIESENYVLMANSLFNKDYLELNKCQSVYFKDQNYCNELMQNLNIKKLYLTQQNLQYIKDKKIFDSNTQEFIDSIDFNTDDGYRLIAKFNDNTYGTLKVLSGNKYKLIISDSCTPYLDKNYTIFHKLNSTKEDILDPSRGHSGCGTVINVSEFVDSTNSCIYYTGKNKSEFSLSLDETLNTATIFYDKYASSLTINYYEKGTTTPVSEPVVLNRYCGDTIYIDNYIKTIANREFIYSTKQKVVMTKNNETVNLYYGLEGENVYD